jgi:2-keto-4-pentenoate hydratase
VATADLSAEVELLYRARLTGQMGLDISSAKLDRDGGLRLQLAVLDKYLGAGDSLTGWKVSYTSGKARDLMGPDYRPFGYILGSRTYSSGATVSLFDKAQIECEIALRIGETIDRPLSPGEAREAVSEIVTCFELNEIRYSKQSDDATILADGCGQWGLVHGDATPPMSDPLETTSVRLIRDGEVVAKSLTNLILDDPYLSLSRLSEMLSRFDRAIDAGALVITGSLVKASVEAPGRWSGSFGKLGAVSVDFA